ncbi:hypothetical protein PR048_004402 [Dryococelus australis]|uniref:Uncharacterized protein n=1 Tax=Dryococelus australis TaxID=614101 RepID=A0ABQ9I7A8_9NEOP|nr:hypothetical protein PR048_004402 [Dryococelus australis]
MVAYVFLIIKMKCLES